MQKWIQRLVLTYVVIILLTGWANAPEGLQTVSYDAATTHETRNEDKLYVSEVESEQDLQHIEMSSVANSNDLTLEETERMKEIEKKLDSAKTLTAQILSTYSEENENIEKQISELLEEIAKQLEQHSTYMEVFHEDYDAINESFEQYKQMIQSIMEKMEAIKISSSTDMSQTFGFTEEEFIYILKNVRGKRGNLIIEDSIMAENVAKGIIEAVVEYPVNEIFAVSVMSFESGYFTSKLVVEYNNFGGMQKSAEDGAYHFETSEEGIRKAVKCIHSNLKGNNTANEVNETYCAPHIVTDENGEPIINKDGEIEKDVYYWARNVLSIMKSYARGISDLK